MGNRAKYRNEPKILVISNNAFSKTKNNGKTLASFFKSFSSENIAQLYFSEEIPTEEYFNNYYQITDASVLKSCLFRFEKYDGRIEAAEDDFRSKRKTNNRRDAIFKNLLIKLNIMRIFREAIWKLGKWDRKDFITWVDEFSPDIIFLCAGDSGFAYDIAYKVKTKFNSKLVIFMTDDYVLPRNTINFIWWLRRYSLLKKMKSILAISDLYITISKKMKDVYKNFLGKESIVMMNIATQLKKEENKNKIINQKINLVYVGGLHLKRYKTLILLANTIKKYNMSLTENEKKAYLKIYSSNVPDSNIVNRISVPEASEFCGELNLDEVTEVLNKCDIPVHVESFDKKSIEATRLSISTKIPEYLSLGKPILAIGPKEIASMEYLEDVAFYINRPKNIFIELKYFLKNDELRNNLGQLAQKKFKECHDVEVNALFLKRELCKLIK